MVHRSRPAASAGFVLPLSITGALVLLLSSLSMQSLVLHTHQVQAAQRTRLHAEDRLASAAQRLAADLQGRFACLQTLPLADWSQELITVSCPPDLDANQLKRQWLEGQEVQLTAWEPQEGGGSFQLQLAGGDFSRRYWLSGSGVKELG